MSKNQDELGRRSFVTGALGAAAGIGVTTLLANKAEAQQGGPSQGGTGGAPRIRPEMQRPTSLYRLEANVRDCQVTGKIPSDLNGAFYRVGPDAQYPLNPRDIPFDGEGHVSMFRIKDGRVDYRSRMVRNDRYLAQDKAGRRLFQLYRNPEFDDPTVKGKGLSRSTANTHIINHRNYLLALKEDSPPSAMDLLTLDTVVPNYTFDDQLPSKTFTAHPKVDSETGNLVAFGYEADGFGSDIVSIFEITPQGKIVWHAKIKVPYVGMLHDFAVTQKHIVFYVIPLAIDEQQMKDGGIHWSWDPAKPTYFGFVRRGGDGKDIRWIEGPTRSATHVMGTFDDGDKLYVDVEMSMSNPFPFMPMRGGLEVGSDLGFQPYHAVVRGFVQAASVELRHRAAISSRRGAAAPRRPLQHDALPLRLLAMPRSECGAGHGRRLLRAIRSSDANVHVVQRRHRDLARRVLLCAEERERTGGHGLSDGSRNAQR